MGFPTADFARQSAPPQSVGDRLFALPGVARVSSGRFHQGYQERQKCLAGAEPQGWAHHGPFRCCFRSSKMTAPTSAKKDVDEADREVVDQIKELPRYRVRPALPAMAATLCFRGYREGVVRLHMQGACSGCPSSSATPEAWYREHAEALRARGRPR